MSFIMKSTILCWCLHYR